MASDIEIRQFQLSDQDTLLSFLRMAYPAEPRKWDAAFWKWHFLENPHVDPGDIPLWVATSGSKIVGQVAAIPVELKVGEERRVALWIVDYAMLPEYRAGGAAIPLFQKSGTHCKTLLALGFNEKTTAVMRLLRWKALGSAGRYQRLLFPGNAARGIARLTPVRHLANALHAPFLPGRVSSSPRGGELRSVTKFDRSFDELWREAAVQWPCAVVRSSRFLEWQFMRQPGKKYEVLGYYEDDRLMGYAVLFFRKAGPGGAPPKVAISDLCYGARNSEAVIETLLRAALGMAIERRAGSLVTDVMDERIEKALRKLRFRPMKTSPAFAVKTAGDKGMVLERSSWFLTRGDSDVSIFEEPNL